MERTAPQVINLHVKNFAFSRRDGWVGFTYAGAALGTGLLDYDSTARLKNQWTVSNLNYLRSKT